MSCTLTWLIQLNLFLRKNHSSWLLSRHKVSSPFSFQSNVGEAAASLGKIERRWGDIPKLSMEKNAGCLGGIYIGDYTTQLCRDDI